MKVAQGFQATRHRHSENINNFYAFHVPMFIVAVVNSETRVLLLPELFLLGRTK